MTLEIGTMRYLTYMGLLLLGGLLFTGCSKVDRLRKQLEGPTPHEQYVSSLRAAELAETALGRTWLAQSREALEQPVSISTPFQEVGYVDPREPTAAAYQVRLERGRRLLVQVEPQTVDSTRWFVDIFRTASDTSTTFTHVISARDSLILDIEVSRSASYLVRVQPELLKGGQYRIVFQTQSSLTFPVADKDSRAIRSVFGDPREGGRRRHHGVDIFADRGTPAVAASDGYVARVGTNRLGGNVIWLRDEHRRQSYYYAHLDSQIVRRSGPVEAGDTLGLVGNSGNARTTPPHLHFGIYSRGPVDPYPFVDNVTSDLPVVTTDTSRLGRPGRIRGSLVNLRSGPSTETEIRRQMQQHTVFAYAGASNDWIRIRLPDGVTGYVAADLTEPADTPIDRLSNLAGARLLHKPRQLAAVIDRIDTGSRTEILGQYGAFLFARTPERSGWLEAPRQ